MDPSYDHAIHGREMTDGATELVAEEDAFLMRVFAAKDIRLTWTLRTRARPIAPCVF